MAQSYMPQQRTSGYCLRILQGEEYGKIYNLTEMVNQGRRILTIGRHQGNSIYIKSDFSDYMSRFHCTIELASPTQWAIRDGQWRNEYRQWVKSSNGTYVNSRPVNENGFYLKAGDIIAIGDVTLRFENY
jgi:pSer/pThr/pTyr-binding forkhead associated (FHA) protein